MNAVAVFARDGEARASSRDVATAFEKEHRTVLRSIDSLMDQEPSLRLHNFVQTSGDRAGAVKAQDRYFEMNRAGFMLLVMGFTGPKALKLKLAWIDEFDRMEDRLRSMAANEVEEGPTLYVGNDDVAARLALMTEVRGLARLYGKQAARLHLLASGRFDHIRGIADEVEAAEHHASRQASAEATLPPPMETGPLWEWAGEASRRTP